jgi:hypothetical protein
MRQASTVQGGGKQQSRRAMSLIVMPSTGVIPAMPVEGIIDPALLAETYESAWVENVGIAYALLPPDYTTKQ